MRATDKYLKELYKLSDIEVKEITDFSVYYEGYKNVSLGGLYYAPKWHEDYPDGIILINKKDPTYTKIYSFIHELTHHLHYKKKCKCFKKKGDWLLDQILAEEHAIKETISFCIKNDLTKSLTKLLYDILSLFIDKNILKKNLENNIYDYHNKAIIRIMKNRIYKKAINIVNNNEYLLYYDFDVNCKTKSLNDCLKILRENNYV